MLNIGCGDDDERGEAAIQMGLIKMVTWGKYLKGVRELVI